MTPKKHIKGVRGRKLPRSLSKDVSEMQKNAPYYVEMDKIMERLRELSKLEFPRYRSHYASDGNLVTEATAEYLEQESLIVRWNEFFEYEKALAGAVCRNHLLVSLRLRSVVHGPARFDPTVAATIAISVYRNSPINY